MEMEMERGRLMELPVDTLVDILLRLPAKSVGCIKCVSKTLLKTVSDVSFSTLHTRLWGDDGDQIPRLMYCIRNEDLVTLQSLKYKDNTFTKGRYTITVSSSTPGFVRFVFRNIICLGFCWTGDCVLVNALGERGVLRLPECTFATQESILWFGMGFDDKTNTYKIVCVSRKYNDPRRHTSAHVLVLGTNLWRQTTSLPPCDLDCGRTEDVVCANGAVHWLTYSEKIASFDLNKEEFYWTPTPPTFQSSYKPRLDSYVTLFSLRGCLAIVETQCYCKIRNIEVWVLKDFDEKEKLWKTYYKNKLPDSSPLLFNGAPGVWEHGIFFMKHDMEENEIYVFFMDVRCGSVNCLVYPLHLNDFYLGTSVYTETLISLKDYGDLEEVHQVIT